MADDDRVIALSLSQIRRVAFEQTITVNVPWRSSATTDLDRRLAHHSGNSIK